MGCHNSQNPSSSGCGVKQYFVDSNTISGDGTSQNPWTAIPQGGGGNSDCYIYTISETELLDILNNGIGANQLGTPLNADISATGGTVFIRDIFITQSSGQLYTLGGNPLEFSLCITDENGNEILDLGSSTIAQVDEFWRRTQDFNTDTTHQGLLMFKVSNFGNEEIIGSGDIQVKVFYEQVFIQ